MKNSLKLAFIVSFLLLTAACGQRAPQTGDATINIVRTDKAGTSAMDTITLQINRAESQEVILTDGKGSITLHDITTLYPTLKEKNSKNEAVSRGQFFINQGDTVTVYFDGSEQALAAKEHISTDKDTVITSYLQTFTPSAYPENYVQSFNAYNKELEAIRLNTLAIMQDKGLPKEFVRIETMRLNYFYAQALVSYPVVHAIETGEQAKLTKECVKAIMSYYKDVPELAQVQEYQDFMLQASRLLSNKSESEDKDAATSAYIDGYIKGSYVRNALMKALQWHKSRK